MLLIYGEPAEEALEKSDWSLWEAYNQLLQDRGVWIGSEALRKASVARTVEVCDGRPMVTDGPFAETKEQLAGYYMVDCDEDEAIELASKIPTAADGTARIEVRPVFEFRAGSGELPREPLREVGV